MSCCAADIFGDRSKRAERDFEPHGVIRVVADVAGEFGRTVLLLHGRNEVGAGAHVRRERPGILVGHAAGKLDRWCWPRPTTAARSKADRGAGARSPRRRLNLRACDKQRLDIVVEIFGRLVDDQKSRMRAASVGDALERGRDDAARSCSGRTAPRRRISGAPCWY